MSLAFYNSSFLQMKRSLDSSSSAMETAMERLSSGLRINSAKDDPGNLYIAERLDVKMSALDVANENIALGINKVNTFENRLSSMSDLFGNIRELALGAASGVQTPSALQAYHDQAQDVLANIESIANEANADVGAASVALGDATFTTVSMDIQIGTDAKATSRYSVDELGVGFHLFDGIDLTTQAGAQAALTEIDEMMEYLNGKRSFTGAQINILDSIRNNNSNKSIKHSENLSSIRDADVAKETAELTKQQIIQETTMMLLTQLGEMQSSLVLNLL